MYLPYTIAMQHAREELKPRVLESDQSATKPVDDCWSPDRVETTVPSPLVLVPREHTLV